MSYSVARDALLGLIGLKTESAPEAIETALRRSVERWFPAQVAEVYPDLARPLDVPLAAAMAEPVQYLTPEALQQRILQAVRDFVRAHSLEQPLVLAWEDLHWSDPSSLQVIETLLPL